MAGRLQLVRRPSSVLAGMDESSRLSGDGEIQNEGYVTAELIRGSWSHLATYRSRDRDLSIEFKKRSQRMASYDLHQLHPSGRCPICDTKVTTVYFTSGGHAFHARKDCPSMLSRSKQMIESSKVQVARGRGKLGCHQCVNGVCVRCAAGRHEKCDPERAGITFCECSAHQHRY